MALCTDRLAQQTGDTYHAQPHESSSSSEKPKKRRFWKVGKAVTTLSHLFGEFTSNSIDNQPRMFCQICMSSVLDLPNHPLAWQCGEITNWT